MKKDLRPRKGEICSREKWIIIMCQMNNTGCRVKVMLTADEEESRGSIKVMMMLVSGTVWFGFCGLGSLDRLFVLFLLSLPPLGT